MTEEIYLTDSYVKTFKAKVTKVTQEGVILDRTAFYPGGGGLENDVGKMLVNDKEIQVLEVKREFNDIVHKIKGNLSEGDTIEGIIDWERRYSMMKLHTASHIIAAIAYNKYGAMVTGGHISPEYAKDDFNVEDKNVLTNIINEANDIIKKNIEVKVYFKPKDEALKIPGIVKLMDRNPPNVPIWRIVEIPGIDIQADGGPHVKNTSEIGHIELIKVENRGKNKKRVYYTLASSRQGDSPH
jgi:misacylated tRNA(Ala) deacylase